MARTKRIIDKVIAKRSAKKCRFCSEHDYALLDVHRIVPGEEGGKYTKPNTVVVCCACHRRIHDGQIVIDRYYPSTSGQDVLHFWDANGEERWE